MKEIYEIAGQVVEKPLNGPEVQIQLNFDVDNQESGVSVSVNNYEIGRDGAALINAHFDDGFIWEGVPFKYSIANQNTTVVLRDAFLDISSDSTSFMCDKVESQVMERGGDAWFERNEDSFTFEFLAKGINPGEPGFISPQDYVFVPYINSTVPNNREIAMLTIMGYILGVQIFNLVKDIISLAVELVGQFPLIFGTILKIIVLLLFLAFLIVAMINLLRELVDAIISPVKYHACMRLQTLLERGAERLDQTFESSIFDDPFWRDVYVLPQKFDSPVDPESEGRILGFTRPTPEIQTGYPEGTYGDLIREFKKIINGRKIVGGGVIRVEPKRFNPSTPQYTVKPVEQPFLEFKTNANELKANYNFAFSTDLQDTNTINEFEGTISEVITSPTVIINPDMVVMKGRQDVRTKFSQGKRKNELTGVEELLIKTIIEIQPFIEQMVIRANRLLGTTRVTLGGPEATSGGTVVIRMPGARQIRRGGIITRLSDIGGALQEMITNIENRKGMLKLSSDQVQVPKLLGLDVDTRTSRNTKLKVAADDKLKSNIILQTYHNDEFFTPSPEFPNGNQWKIFTADGVTFCLEDLLQIKPLNAPANNLIFDHLGREAELISLDWNPHSELAQITYRVNEKYSDKLQQKIVTPNGF